MSDHLQPEQLLALLDDDLPEAEEHLRTCAACREDVEAMRSGLDQYLAWHEQVVKPLATPPPAPWKDLDLPVRVPVFARPARRSFFRPARLIWAVAAASAAFVLAYAGYRRLPSVQASDLLAKALAAAPSQTSGAFLHVHTPSRDFVRPAVLQTAPSPDRQLAGAFEAAHYDWLQPFGARPFAAWRTHVADKHDTVEYQRDVCLIRTSSAAGPLSQATLVLRTADLAPVRELLEFRDAETIEITPATAQATTPEVILPTPGTRTPRPAEPVGSREPIAVRTLHVFSALHSIGADLGVLEYREVGDRLVLLGPGLSAARRDEIHRAVAGIDGVDLAFGDGSSAPAATSSVRRTNPKLEGPAPLRPLLESKLSSGQPVEEVVNQILDTSDAAMAQAFALRTLARRYPPVEEEQLNGSDRTLLASLHADYARQLDARVTQLAQMLAPLVSVGPAPPLSFTGSWQNDAERTFAPVQALDSVLSEALAGPPRSTIPEPELVKRIENALSRAKNAARQADSAVRPK